MKIWILHILAYCILGCAATAQSINGHVLEEATAKPVIGATVFISNSSVGVSSDEKGAFVLKTILKGKFTLVVSSIGYETFVKEFTLNGSDLNLSIELKHKPTDLNEVVITPSEKNGWINWGDLFIEHFIGTSSYARSCKISNPKVLRFRRNEKENFLTVFASEPIIIENKALGYFIKYNLKEFKYYFATNAVYYSGYALFEDMSTKDEKSAAKYNETRLKVYGISLMHFMRSLYNQNTEAEGFRVLRKINQQTIELKNTAAVETEYDGKEKFDTIYEISNTSTQIKIVANENAINKKTEYSIDKASFNSIRSFTNGNIELTFADTLQVIYTKSRPPFEYTRYVGDTKESTVILSELNCILNSPITVMANGSFVPNNLAMNGFWGWWEKLAIMLPYDYQPGK